MDVCHSIDSPVGPLTLWSDGQAITRLDWRGPKGAGDHVTAQASRELDEYFAGTRRDFTVSLARPSSKFKAAFAQALIDIPFGETLTYGDMAGPLQVSAQAIGQACGGNPIPILIPCHRVLGADNLGGYSGAGGIETKVWLLKHEGSAGLLI